MTEKQKILLFSGLILITAVLTFLLIPYLVTNKNWGWEYSSNTGVIGDTIGGITGPLVGFIGVILTFLAFYIQFQANQVQVKALEEQKTSAKQQENQILLQQFESNFFELLKLHRENVSELDYRNNKGRNVIIKIVNEFFEIIDALQKSKTNVIQANRLDEQDIANIAYTILFFGTDETVSDVLENRFFEKYGKIEISISCFIREELREKENPYHSDKYYFNGHQSRLGHYFRHLRRIVTFVHRNNFLTETQKKEYIRILRAQLSNHEQIILFFNSISDLGLKWELKNDTNEQLITTYNLIRNIPLGSIYGYRPKRYYPQLKMENDFEIKM
jgi:hypothetical protein